MFANATDCPASIVFVAGVSVIEGGLFTVTSPFMLFTVTGVEALSVTNMQ